MTQQSMAPDWRTVTTIKTSRLVYVHLMGRDLFLHVRYPSGSAVSIQKLWESIGKMIGREW